MFSPELKPNATQGEISQRMQPVLREIAVIEDEIIRLSRQAGLDPAEMEKYAIDPNDHWYHLAHQFLHVETVLFTVSNLKFLLAKYGFPERTFAYKATLGFPLPAETASCRKVGFLPFGEEPLEKLTPAVYADEDAGIHFYIVKGKGGKGATLLTIKDAPSGYEWTDEADARERNALIPRVLKGLGTEFVLNTVESVPATSRQEGIGIILGTYESNRISARADPTGGDQTFVGPVFGRALPRGPHPSEVAAAHYFDILAQQMINISLDTSSPPPVCRGSFLLDIIDPSSPTNPWERLPPGLIQEMQGDLGGDIELVLGQASTPELIALSQNSTGGGALSTSFNRILPSLNLTRLSPPNAVMNDSGNLYPPILPAVITEFFHQLTTLARNLSKALP